VLGFAKLLPQIVPVKRETLQVVSLAMTGLMRGWGRVFHIEENKGRFRFVELGQEILFWDRMSRQGLGLPWFSGFFGLVARAQLKMFQSSLWDET
jgi:hypothetical protein